ncbi:cytoplasmic tRNA 2-thiolation protein 2 [Geosmithia morbida]|uniref:Cytoplasmic tRNA 2-thiolation protein 2 n=1 Tax=Geosmithia morbida TaxID=1094350 RepID=A0A9P5D691_9HYPO|nr:cytoplasmic tRNA 2-thiolation protein 2 [Geosmithia morbida]KAF4123274.1 cytoplasmic tRNA 2-thiolation protein 2 [Geosmithia morbida]
MTAPPDTKKPCRRCKAEDAPLTLRHAPSCTKCFLNYIEIKVAKRFGYLHHETRTSTQLEPRRYVAGLSFGKSSSALACLLDEQARFQASKKSASPFEVLVVHVDTDLDHNSDSDSTSSSPARRLLSRYSGAFPHVAFECVPLTQVLNVPTVDWSALPGLPPGGRVAARLRSMFDSLPSLTAKVDVMRHLVRHLLIHIGTTRDYAALLLGHNTTALAALTMSEVANGRGFSVPWQVNDGPCTLTTKTGGSGGNEVVTYHVHYPLRETFSGEVTTYVSLVPSLAAVVEEAKAYGGDGSSSAVVSHKDTSIDDVMRRYFESVEEPYSGIVANVVRTTGKLDRVRGQTLCGLCSVTLDQHGDSRWAGEMGTTGADEESHPNRLCYGCKRSVYGC